MISRESDKVRTVIAPESGSAWQPTRSAMVGLLLSAVLIACGSGANVISSRVTVTLSTFSGRPDPEWQLEEAEVIALRDILDSLDPTDEPFDNTGLPPYMGFRLKGEGIVTSVRYIEVYDGVVLLLDSDFERLGRLGDPEYRVETYLFEVADSELDEEITHKASAGFHELMTGQD